MAREGQVVDTPNLRYGFLPTLGIPGNSPSPIKTAAAGPGCWQGAEPKTGVAGVARILMQGTLRLTCLGPQERGRWLNLHLPASSVGRAWRGALDHCGRSCGGKGPCVLPLCRAQPLHRLSLRDPWHCTWTLRGLEAHSGSHSFGRSTRYQHELVEAGPA